MVKCRANPIGICNPCLRIPYLFLDRRSQHIRFYQGFSPAYGFDGIPIALLAGGNPFGILLGSFLFGALRNGSTNMQIKAGISTELVDVVQGVLICFVCLEYIIRFYSGKLLSRKRKGGGK